MTWSRSTHPCQWEQWIAAFAASSVMFGYETDVVWFSLSKHMMSKLELVLEVVLVIIGSITGAVIADIYGRRGTLLGSLIFVIPRMAVPYLTAELTIWINTLVLSFASGITCVVVPLYISEIASANKRGNLMLSQLSVHSFGRLTLTATAVFTPNGDFGAVNFWRSAILAVSTLLHVITLWVFPEAPQYSNWKKKRQEKIESLISFQGIAHVELTQDPTNHSTNSVVKNKEERWWDRLIEIGMETLTDGKSKLLDDMVCH